MAAPAAQAQAAASLAEGGTSGEGPEAEADGKREKRARKKKDPAAPKKALTGYLVFINGKREQVVKEHPEADLKDQVTPPLPHLLTCCCAPPLHGQNRR